jgi:type IV pilus assembly protein PilE
LSAGRELIAPDATTVEPAWRTASSRAPGQPTEPRRAAGITLVELLVVLVILGVIAAFAVPAYRSYVLESRRGAAQSALLELGLRQEQFFLDARAYTATVGPGGLNAALTTDGGHYALSVDAATAACPLARCFRLRATPQGAQTADGCGELTLGEQGQRTPAQCW